MTQDDSIRMALIKLAQEQQQARVDVITVNLMREGINKHRARELADHFVNFTLPPPLPVQEPVAWITPDGEGFRIRFSLPTNDVPLGWDALYTTPPLPVQRQPLTDEWIESAGARWVRDGHDLYGFARAIEAAHGIKEQ
tara:strand:- start:118 stop:534 length:417 start_codon:yes stop_codon:yes gene_type:complete